MLNIKKMISSLLAVMLVAFVCTPLFAREPAPGSGQRPRDGQGEGKHQRGKDGKRHCGPDIDKMAEKLGLTEEQKNKITEIFKAHKQKMQNWRDEHAEEIEAMREKHRAARKSDDADAMEKLKEEGKALHEAHREMMEELKTQIEAVLTPEQVEQFKKNFAKRRHGKDSKGRRHNRMKAIAEKLGLTDEQKEMAKAIIQQARTDADEAETREQKMEIMKAAKEKIRDSVLTDEQRTQAEEMRKHRRKKGEQGEDGKRKKHKKHDRRRKKNKAEGNETDEE